MKIPGFIVIFLPRAKNSPLPPAFEKLKKPAWDRINNKAAGDANANNTNKKGVFKNCASFTTA